MKGLYMKFFSDINSVYILVNMDEIIPLIVHYVSDRRKGKWVGSAHASFKEASRYFNNSLIKVSCKMFWLNEDKNIILEQPNCKGYVK